MPRVAAGLVLGGLAQKDVENAVPGVLLAGMDRAFPAHAVDQAVRELLLIAAVIETL